MHFAHIYKMFSSREKLAQLKIEADAIGKNLLIMRHLIRNMEKSFNEIDITCSREIEYCENEILFADASEFVERDMFINTDKFKFNYAATEIISSNEVTSKASKEDKESGKDSSSSVAAASAVTPKMAKLVRVSDISTPQVTVSKASTVLVEKRAWNRPLDRPTWMSKEVPHIMEFTAEEYLQDLFKDGRLLSLPAIKLELKRREVPWQIIKQISGPGNLYKLLKKIPGLCETSVKNNPFFVQV